MSSAVKLTNPVGGSLSLVMDDTVTTDETYQVPSTDWDGVVLGGAELTAVGIVGTNPYATLYPDGSIVGGSDNGKFTKWANGNLDMQFKDSTIKTINGTNGALYQVYVSRLYYPIIFTRADSLNVYTHTSSTSGSWASNRAGTNDLDHTGDWRIVAPVPGTTAYIAYSAKGRWK